MPISQRQGRLKDCSTSSSNPRMEGPWCRFRREARARERHRDIYLLIQIIAASPDADSLIWCEIQLITWFYIKRGVPRIDVPDNAVDPILPRCVLIGLYLIPQDLFSYLPPPRLRPSKKNTLLTGKPINHRGVGVTWQRGAIGVERDQEAPEIGDIFSHC